VIYVFQYGASKFAESEPEQSVSRNTSCSIIYFWDVCRGLWAMAVIGHGVGLFF
jgi:hypothetical protein